jgi:thiol-disulfide isomerase/thioredoxin
MHHSTFPLTTLAALLIALSPCTRQSLAQPQATPQSPQLATANARANALLEKARAAIKDVRTLSYKAFVEDLAQPGSTTEADVFARRIDGGGWQLGVKGTTKDTQGKESHRFQLGYDGLTARSLRINEKAVDDRSLEKPREVRAFFAGQGVLHPIAWEALDDETLLGENAVATFVSSATIAGEPCDLIELTSKSNPESAGSARVRVAIALSDNLPRRIERVRVDAGGAVLSRRSLELRGLKVNKDSVLGAFTLDVPDGYRVRTKDTSAMKAKALEEDVQQTSASDAKATKQAGETETGAQSPAPSPSGPSATREQVIAQWPHDERLLRVGSKAPAFSLKDTTGTQHALSEYRGKIVILDFWATWCPPCRVALPAIDQLHSKYKDNDKVVILGMNAQRGRPGNAGEFLKEKGLDFTTLLDAEDLRKPYQSPGIPTFYVIDPKGKVVWGGVGLAGPAGATSQPSDEDYQKVLLDVLSAHIDALLEKK